jgi:hypothetical protein
MPLVPVGGSKARVSERHERARKIKPQYAQGALVAVAWARNQSEAEPIEGMLLEEGIPSVLRRSAGFDVPDFMASDRPGPRRARRARRRAHQQHQQQPTGDTRPRRAAARRRGARRRPFHGDARLGLSFTTS